MSSKHTVTRIDLEAPGSIAAREAEKSIFGHYDLNYHEHYIHLEEPDLRLRVLEVGSGQPLIIVPGGAGDAWTFAPLMAELDGWRMIAINRPGGGLSDGIDNRQVDLKRLASDTIRTVADYFEMDIFPIICNSMGGLWSAWFTLEHPDRVSLMVQMGCPALALGTSAPGFMRLLGVPGVNRFIAPMIQPDNVQSALDGLKTQGSYQRDIDRLPVEFAEAAYHFWQLPTYLDQWKTLIAAVTTITGANPKYALTAGQLAQIQQPMQIIWGENDVFGDLAVAHEMERVIPNARLHEMDTGHLPFIDQPEETGRVISQFLAQETAVSEAEPAITG